MKIKDYWRRLKEINDILPYFPPDKSIGVPHITPTVLDDNDLKDILDGNLPQAFCAVCKHNQYIVLAHPISDAMDYLQDIESTCTTHLRRSNTSTSHNNFSKGKGNGKGKGKGNGKSQCGKCPLVSQDLYTLNPIHY